MPEKVTYDSKHKIIRVYAWGIDQIVDWRKSLDEVLRLYKKHRVARLLVDVRDSTSSVKTMEIFDFAVSWPVTIRVAILTSQANKADVNFVATVASNRGRLMKVFLNVEKALEWLNI